MIQDKKLLIVEDEADACLLMARLLRHKFAHIEAVVACSISVLITNCFLTLLLTRVFAK